MAKSYVIRNMLTGVNNFFSYIKLEEAEEVLEEIFNKIENDIELEESEEKYLKIYFTQYYKDKVGGRLYPTPNYQQKLKPLYKKIANYYIVNQDKITYESAIFLQYYYLTEMASSYGMTPDIIVGNSDYFKKHPGCAAYHKRENRNIGREIPVICYNPEFIEKYAKEKNVLALINLGFHELEHEVQDIEMNKEKIDNAQAIIWAKEIVSRKVIGEIFYSKNYTEHFMERDARYYAQKRIEGMLLELGCADYLRMLPEYLRMNEKYDTSIIFKDVENEDEETLAIDLLESISTNFIKKYASHLLKDYPVLRTIYDENGNKKLLSQIQLELEERKENEIKNSPNKTIEIERKYSRLLYSICQTDNDLRMQYLCMDAAYYEAEGDEFSLKTKMAQIRKLTQTRSVSYERFIDRIDSRLSELDAIIRKNNDYKSPEREKVVAAKKATLELKKSVLKYNSEFNEKYNKENTKKQIERNLSTKLGTNIDRYNWFISTEGYVYTKNQTKEQLQEQYKKHVRLLTEKTATKEEFDEYFKQLSFLYDELFSELEESQKVPGR